MSASWLRKHQSDVPTSHVMRPVMASLCQIQTIDATFRSTLPKQCVCSRKALVTTIYMAVNARSLNHQAKTFYTDQYVTSNNLLASLRLTAFECCMLRVSACRDRAAAQSAGHADHVLMLCRNPQVMHEALDMHDACLRAVLHQHHGYEVN